MGWQLKNRKSNDGLSSDDITHMLTDCVARGLLPASFQNCRIAYFSSGWYNKLYALHLLQKGCSQSQECALSTDLPQLLLRVSKPILPFFKVESEVASICFAQDQGVPVPQVYYYDSSGQNTLGLDWIIYERIPGSYTIDDYRDQLVDYGCLPYNRLDPWLTLGDEIARYTRSLRKVAFKGIGSLYLDQTAENRRYLVGPLCMPLFGSCPTWVCHPPGPFKTAFELIRALLRLWKHMTTWHRKDGTCLHPADLALTKVEEDGLHRSSSSSEKSNANKSQQKDDGGNHSTDNHRSFSNPGPRPGSNDNHCLRAIWKGLDQLVDHLESTYGSSPTLPSPRTYLAHRDLHNANALVQKADASDLGTAVKAILDWEFSWTLPDELWYGYLPKSQSQFAVEAREGDGPHRGRICECSAVAEHVPLELLFGARANIPETGLSWELLGPLVEAESERRAKDGSYADPYLDAEDMGKFVAACFMMTSTSSPGSYGGAARDWGGTGNQENIDQQQQQQRRPPATGWVLIVRELVDKLGPHVGRRGRGMPKDNLIWLEKLIAAFRHCVGSGADDKKD